MFSSLPKLADKNFIIAFLVPTLAFILALAWAIPGLAQPVVKALGEPSSLTDLTVAVVALWFLAVALLLANQAIYRAMEGYTGPLSSLALKAWMTDRWTARMKALDLEYVAIDKLPQAEQGAANAALNRRLADILRRYPRKAGQLLGTHFGNINRAFEGYSGRVYGVDSIIIWPRLSGVIPSAFQTVLSDARAQVDCFLNLTALSLLFAAIELGRWAASFGAAVWNGLPASSGPMAPLLAHTAAATDWGLLFPAFLAVAFALGAYRMLLDSALALGDQFKAAFDLYLGSLPKQLGYALPKGADAQKAFWDRLRDSYSYLDPTPQTHRLTTPPDPAPAGKGDGEGAAGGEDAEA